MSVALPSNVIYFIKVQIPHFFWLCIIFHSSPQQPYASWYFALISVLFEIFRFTYFFFNLVISSFVSIWVLYGSVIEDDWLRNWTALAEGLEAFNLFANDLLVCSANSRQFKEHPAYNTQSAIFELQHHPYMFHKCWTTVRLLLKKWLMVQDLTHWGRNKMDAISQTTSSSAFSWMKMFEFRLKFQWSLFLRVQ